MNVDDLTFEEAKRVGQTLDADVRETETVLRRFPRSKMGLVPDDVRTSVTYRNAKMDFDRAFARLRNFNTWFTKKFKHELRAERRNRR